MPSVSGWPTRTTLGWRANRLCTPKILLRLYRSNRSPQRAMTLPVVFCRRFQDDLGAGFDWYEEQRSGLGQEFLSAVQSTLRSIEQFPEMFVFIHRDVRRAIVSRFPFAVFYLIESRR